MIHVILIIIILLLLLIIIIIIVIIIIIIIVIIIIIIIIIVVVVIVIVIVIVIVSISINTIIITCLGSNGIDMTKHGGHSTAASHQLCVQRPVLHASFWAFHHHIRTVQPPLSCLHHYHHSSSDHDAELRTKVQLSKDEVHQVVLDIQSPTAHDRMSDSCQDVFVVLPVAVSPDKDAGVDIMFSGTCGETADTASAKHCGIPACKDSEGLLRRESTQPPDCAAKGTHVAMNTTT